MGGYYNELIRDMTWSYSRLTSFDDCPYGWFLRYIRMSPKGEQKFFSSFGSFIHELLEQYLKGEKSREQIVTDYLVGFSERAAGEIPDEAMRLRYFENGLQYLKELEPFPFEIVAAEQKVRFKLGDSKFVGVIDVLGKDGDGMLILDHKSRRLKPRSRRKEPTETDRELDSYLRQLYLYSCWLEQSGQELPKKLMFNCFRDRRLITEKFDPAVFERTKQWAQETAERIAAEEAFPPHPDYFRCTYLCDARDECEYYETNFGKR